MGADLQSLGFDTDLSEDSSEISAAEEFRPRWTAHGVGSAVGHFDWPSRDGSEF